MVHTLTVGATTQTWALDAASRLKFWTVATSGSTTAAKVNHFDDATSDAPDWIAETADASTWTANVSGLLGDLAATATYTSTGGLVIAPDYDEYGNPPDRRVFGTHSHGFPHYPRRPGIGRHRP
jgi:hypothetical protein